MGLPVREYYKSTNADGVLNSSGPRMLNGNNKPIRPTWVPSGW